MNWLKALSSAIALITSVAFALVAVLIAGLAVVDNSDAGGIAWDKVIAHGWPALIPMALAVAFWWRTA